MSRAHERACVLLQKARDDAYMLAQGSRDRAVSDWILGFHAQQSVEKAFKAVLTDRNVEFPRTHDLTALMDLVADSGAELPSDNDRLDELTPYGSRLRYEGGTEEIGAYAFDREWAIGCVERTLSWAARQLESDR